jgi:hypothetical protein
MSQLSSLTFNQFRDFTLGLHPIDFSTSPLRTRFVAMYVQNKQGEYYRLNDVVQALEHFSKQNQNISPSLISKIRQLEQETISKAQNARVLYQVTLVLRERVSRLLYDRSSILARIEFPGKTLITSKDPYRLLLLKGERGVVACKVRGDYSATFPHLSTGNIIESITRTYLRARNLIAVRGTVPGSRMIGPCDYFGNLEAPHQHHYTIHIDDQGVPAFLTDNSEVKPASTPKKHSTVSLHDVVTTVKATWHKGTLPATKDVKHNYANNNQLAIGDSLFPNAGILEIEEEKIALKRFNAKAVDLTPFKARLVSNKEPFKITSDVISPSDDYRPVSYLFEPNYANYQVNEGGGLFLETHQFAQTMTPLQKSARGFVTLGKWVDESHTHLELIGVRIPFGYTLIVEKDCIHGDANLSGMFMMCMTSNHRTMSTADTVFLKNPLTKKNVSIFVKGEKTIQPSLTASYPFASFKTDTKDNTSAFNHLVNAVGKVFNPLVSV